MFTKVMQENSHRVLLLISHLVAFVIGLYVVGGISRSQLDQLDIGKNDQIYIRKNDLLSPNLNTDLVNISDRATFYHVAGTLHQTDKVTTHHYEAMYEKNLRKYIGTAVTILEIGLGCGMAYPPGASAYVWRTYFGPRADIHFIEYNRDCGEKWYNVHGPKVNVTMHYGSQEDVAFLKSMNIKDGYFDVIVDDGGHTMTQQITSFNYLLSKVRSGGLYAIEDIYTSYMDGHGGAYLRNTTTIEFIKRLVDDIQSRSPHRSTDHGQRLFSFEISDKICVFNVK